MTRAFLLVAATAACAMSAPSALHAQRPRPAIVTVVDTVHVVRTCRQCGVANAALQTQATALQARAAHLSGLIATEAHALEALVAALPEGGRPDPTLQARLDAFQGLRDNAAREIAQRREQLRRDVESVRSQILARIQPAVTTVMRQHGATDVVERGSISNLDGRIDITGEVLAIVDQNPDPFEVHAPPPRAAPDRRKAGRRP